MSKRPVDIIVFDGLHPPSFTHKFWKSNGLSAVLVFGKPLKWVKGAARVGWKVTSVPLTHAALGGVTDWRGNLSFAFRPQPGTAADVCSFLFEPVGVQAFLSQLVNQTAKGGVMCPPPSAGAVDVATDQVSLERIQAPDSRFVLPSVFTKTGFVRRKLTSQERLLALDFPSTASGSLTEAACTALVGMIRTPVKAVVQVGEQLDFHMQSLVVVSAGQGIKRSAPGSALGSESPSPPKRR